MKTALPLCDLVKLIDNSSADSPFRPMATIRQGLVERHHDPLPGWAEALLN